MTLSLGDELVVALAASPPALTGGPSERPGFSLAALARLTGCSTKAVEEALYDLHRAGLITVNVEIRKGVVCLISAELTSPAGKTLADRKLDAVRAKWRERGGAGAPGPI